MIATSNPTSTSTATTSAPPPSNLSRCKGCNGYGVGLVQSNGFCNHCNSKTSQSSVEIQRTATPPVPYVPATKTPCKFFASGYCRNGTGCQQLHDPSSQIAIMCPVCTTDLRNIEPSKVDEHINSCISGRSGGNQQINDPKAAGFTAYLFCRGCNNQKWVKPALSLCQSCVASSNINETTALAQFMMTVKDPAPLSGYSPFGVLCAYCNRTYEAGDFPRHVAAAHRSATNHKFACPVCQLAGETSYNVTDATNLLTHLTTVHIDMLVAQPGGSQASTATTTTTTTTTTTSTNTGATVDVSSATVGTRYVVQVLEKDMSKECIICFDEFSKGDTIARLECFCVFHKECIDDWLKKSNKCPLHKD